MKKAKPLPWRCGECKTATVWPHKEKEYLVKFKWNNKIHQIIVKNVILHRCIICGYGIIITRSCEQISRAIEIYKKKKLSGKERC